MITNITNPSSNTPIKKHEILIEIQNKLKYLSIINSIQSNKINQNSYMTLLCLRILLRIQSQEPINTVKNKNILKALQELRIVTTDSDSQSYAFKYQLTPKGSSILHDLGIHEHMQIKVIRQKPNETVAHQATKGLTGLFFLCAGILGSMLSALAFADNVIQSTIKMMSIINFLKPILILLVALIFCRIGFRWIETTRTDILTIPLPIVWNVNKKSFLEALLATGSTKDDIQEFNPYIVNMISHKMFQSV